VMLGGCRCMDAKPKPWRLGCLLDRLKQFSRDSEWCAASIPPIQQSARNGWGTRALRFDEGEARG